MPTATKPSGSIRDWRTPIYAAPAPTRRKGMRTRPWPITARRFGLPHSLPGRTPIERGSTREGVSVFDKAVADYDQMGELGRGGWYHYKRKAEAHFQLQHYDKALESIAKAVALNPGDFSNLTWLPLSEVAKCPDEPLRKGLLDLADKTIQLTNGAAEGYVSRACLLDAFERRDEAQADFEKAIRLEPRDAALWIARAALRCARESRRMEASKLNREYPDFWSLQGMAWLGGGKAAEHRSDCAIFLHQLSQTEKPDEANWAAWGCVLAPDTIADWPTAIALANKAVQSDPKSAMYLNTLGAVLYRAGRFDEALARLSEADALVQEPSEAIKSPPAYTWFFLAMTQQRLGHAEEAKPWLDKAVAWTDKIFAEADQGTADLSWNRRLTLKLFRDEATTLLGVTPPVVEPAPAPAAKVDEAQEFPKSTPAPEAAKEEEPPK